MINLLNMFPVITGDLADWFLENAGFVLLLSISLVLPTGLT